MAKWIKLFSNNYKNWILLCTNVGFIAISALILWLKGTSSQSSLILWFFLTVFISVVLLLLVDFYFCCKAKLVGKIHLLLFLGVTLAVGFAWVPGIWKEGELFDLLKEKSIPIKELHKAIKNAAKLEQIEDVNAKNKQLENVDKLLRFPTSEDPNTLKYGYTTLSEFVANTRYLRTAIVIVLSCATGLIFILISIKPLNRHFQLMLMASVFFGVGGLVPYLLSGNKGGNLVIVGLYSGLFTWVFNLHFEKVEKKYELTSGFARSSEQADAIFRYYMRLLVFALGIFGIITVSLMLQVSSLMGEMYNLSPELRQYLFKFLIFHDFYGTMILLVGVVLKLVQLLEASVKLYPSNK